jgi:hypothetical protein
MDAPVELVRWSGNVTDYPNASAVWTHLVDLLAKDANAVGPVVVRYPSDEAYLAGLREWGKQQEAAVKRVGLLGGRTRMWTVGAQGVDGVGWRVCYQPAEINAQRGPLQ